MSQASVPLKLNLSRMLLVVLVFIAGAIYATIAFSAQDLFWFKKGFNERPSFIIIYHNGQKNELRAGQPGYDVMADAVRDTLNSGVARLSGVGLSDASLQDAYKKYVTVEAFFGEPVKLHAWFDTDSPTQMLFPITGRHSELNVVFLGDNNGHYLVNAPVLGNYAPIRQAVQNLGF